MTAADAEIRLFVYERARAGQIPAPIDIAQQFSITPREAGDAMRRLESDHDAVVLLPDSPYIWLADPFSALPTDYQVKSPAGRWYGACIWDAMGIASLVGGRCELTTACPQSGSRLPVTTNDDHLVEATGVVHFAVPPRRWWDSIGFT